MKEWKLQDVERLINQGDMFTLFLYTPICGTCQVAKKMLTVVQELFPTLQMGMCNINYLPQQAQQWSIESVPCLLIIKNGQIHEKIYAFKSVENVFNLVKAYSK